MPMAVQNWTLSFTQAGKGTYRDFDKKNTTHHHQTKPKHWALDASVCILPLGRLWRKQGVSKDLGQSLWVCITQNILKASVVLPFYGFVANDDNYKEEH